MRSRKILFVLSLIALSVASSFARNILEKKMFYLSNTNKTGQARFWVVYLGNFNIKLSRNIPGEGNVDIDASVNLQLLSSGYVEGNGYGAKGKVDCLPALVLSSEGKEDKRIVIDSIDYIYDFGTKVRLLTGETGDLFIDVEGTKVAAKKFLMREYKLTQLYGEEILKEGSTETPIMGISLTPEGAARAQKAQAAVSAAQK